MTSYLRNIFGVSSASNSRNNRNPPVTVTTSVKSHHRSRSASSSPIQNQNLGYIYSAPGTTPPESSRTHRERSNSYVAARANAPSPLRYTYDSATGSRRGHSSHHHGPPPPSPTAQVPIYRSASYKAGERPSPYPLFTPTASFCSTRSASSSVQQGSSSSHRPSRPRTSSSGSGSVAHSEPKPVLKHNRGWSGSKSGPHPHVSFLNPNRPFTLHMHPLLAYSRLHSPPISYDVIFSPSSRTVVDRSTRTAIPMHTLSQPATEPPTATRLVFKSDKLPWPIVVTPSGTSGSKPGRFFIADGASASGAPITNMDLLHAIHHTLSSRVSQVEWDALGHGSRAQRKITRAYEKRCVKMGGGWDGGVRRIDYLGGKTRLVGIEVDKTPTEGGAGKLVFGKA
ncbi:hypothetical protein BD779DRAFT_1155973 [Infundibulicybe gibba]|nr:hypothetical protein BD779DRAFT_1155973 [Infundibulicybe gibba]